MSPPTNNGGKDEPNVNKTWALLQTMEVKTFYAEIVDSL